MKKKLVRGAAVVLGFVGLVVVGLGTRFYVLLPNARPAPDMKAPTTPEAVAKGKYLVEHVTGCTGCHSPIDESKPGDVPVEGKRGAGRDFGPMGKAPFRLRAANLTPDPDTGIGKASDGEIVRAMREGIGRDGRALFPQMPYQTYAKTLSDDDALAIVAYLRTLAPVKNDPGKTEIQFPVSMFIRALPQPLTGSPPPAPSPSDKLARGNWLLDVASCHDCHDSTNERMEKIPGKAFGGGTRYPVGSKTIVAPNISSDKATGIGAYSDDDLRRVFDEGKGKSGRTLYMMPWSYYSGMTKEDKEAMIVALRAQPPVSNLVVAKGLE
jgi:mono/diheme cytochrome c family protein